MEIVESGDSDFVPRSKTTSLSIDQVNDNPDELIEMRGEGRYFGAQDSEATGPICNNCHQRGHIAAKCKTVVCHACGMVDDHYTQHCPKSIVCSNCGEKGHFRNNCTKKQRKLYCQSCSSTNHPTDRCPSIWRSYLTRKDTRKRMGLPNNMYCYNCADKGHYGDDCPEPRNSRVPNPDGSAFSGHNLPKPLRDEYFRMLKKRKSRDEYHDRHNDMKPKKSKNLLSRIKDTFDGGRKKGRDIKKPRKSSSMPQLNRRNVPVHKSGVLPPPGPRSSMTSTYAFPRNQKELPAPSRSSYLSQSSSASYNNSPGYNTGSYNNNNNYNSREGYSRSGYLSRSNDNSRRYY